MVARGQVNKPVTKCNQLKKRIMTVDIKLTHEQHEYLLSRLGSEEAIREWMEDCIDQELRRLAAEKV